ncbi:peptidylprolyl isomerase [Echinicola salinicaeni]|uniref:peptidyl-prolyl cis-trans isomerase n=1 Tax=Echinicola salinicaeni TaxID=2762757 RepID=UPI0016453842|nr:peptidyl-prolyl cis-trans isomerase [Echinicola salinicaeni]
MRKRKLKISSFQIISRFIIILFCTVLSSCDLFKIKNTEEEEKDNPAVASVDNNFLRKADLSFITKETTSKEDSINLATRYIQSWIKKQLMIKEAGKNITLSQAELDKKLLDYRYALIVYEYEKQYIEDNLSKEVTDEEIQQYYDNNRDNFILKEIIVRTNFIKMEKSLSQNTKVEKLLKQNSPEDKETLRELAIKSASNYFLEDSTWIKFEDIILNTPLSNHNNKVQLLSRSNNIIKVEDEEFNYYFNILEYKLQDQIPPVDFVKDEISRIIVNKRKVNLAETLQNNVYKRAQENNEFKIYE